MAPKDHSRDKKNLAEYSHRESAELDSTKFTLLIILSRCIYLPFKYRFRLSTDNRGNQQKNY